jgi:hypothetical protein
VTERSWLQQLSTWQNATKRIHVALQRAHVRTAVLVDTIAARPMLQITLTGDDVLKLADVLERYLTWVDDTSADATRASPGDDAR